VLSDPHRTEEFLRLDLGGRDYEVFSLLHLNTRNRLIAAEALLRGTLDGASVYPREVVHSMIAHRSAAVILYHNHPSAPRIQPRRWMHVWVAHNSSSYIDCFAGVAGCFKSSKDAGVA
jgi:DNA repair protein RadC